MIPRGLLCSSSSWSVPIQYSAPRACMCAASAGYPLYPPLIESRRLMTLLPPPVASQVIKAISGKGAPACNCVALTGMTGEAKMFRAPRKAKAKA